MRTVQGMLDVSFCFVHRVGAVRKCRALLLHRGSFALFRLNNLTVCPSCHQDETVFIYIRCTDVTVWLLLLKSLIYKSTTVFLRWHTEVILLVGSILAES